VSTVNLSPAHVFGSVLLSALGYSHQNKNQHKSYSFIFKHDFLKEIYVYINNRFCIRKVKCVQLEITQYHFS